MSERPAVSAPDASLDRALSETAPVPSGCPSETVILSLVDGSATPRERERIEAHLATCRECRHLVSALAPTYAKPRPRPEKPPELELTEGQIVADKYQIQKILGEGGMGVVVAAEHLLLRRKVALKFLRASFTDDAKTVARFLREARAAAAIESEHVVRVLDVGRLGDTGELYLVLEFLQGNDLAAEVRRRGPLPLAEAAGYVREACSALSLAHARGIVHRDIKPANLFLAERDDGSRLVKVLDFGIAKVAEGREDGVGVKTSANTILGSPRYMSPEQLRAGGAIDARADVWALGVVLFELLTERTPFDGDTMMSLCAAILTDPPRALSSARPDLPEEVSAIVLRCLSKALELRTPSAAALAEELAPFAAGGTSPGIAKVMSRPQTAPLPAPGMSTIPLASPTVPLARPTVPRVPPAAPLVSPAVSLDEARRVERPLLEAPPRKAKRPRRSWRIGLVAAGAALLLGAGVALSLRGARQAPAAASPSEVSRVSPPLPSELPALPLSSAATLPAAPLSLSSPASTPQAGGTAPARALAVRSAPEARSARPHSDTVPAPSAASAAPPPAPPKAEETAPPSPVHRDGLFDRK